MAGEGPVKGCMHVAVAIAGGLLAFGWLTAECVSRWLA